MSHISSSDRMILGPISLLDCFVFVLLLVPQLLWLIEIKELIRVIAKTTLYILFRLPYELIKGRILHQDQHSNIHPPLKSIFGLVIIQCVRYAFAEIPPSVGTVFFKRAVNWPFLRFRMLRHGYWHFPIHFQEVRGQNVHGVWLAYTIVDPPDIVIYYLHGGGFSMGSSYFYAEFLLAWIHLLQTRWGFKNPAIFASDYTLVPFAIFPTQLQQTRAGYDFVISKLADHDPSRVCVAGDSAGGTLVLSLLLLLNEEAQQACLKPGFATLISPWSRLVSNEHNNTQSDYLDVESLHIYACRYLGLDSSIFRSNSKQLPEKLFSRRENPLASPGSCISLEKWRAAIPTLGCHFIFGSEEVFATEIQILVSRIQKAGSAAIVTEEIGGIHAWPIVNLFISSTQRDRFRGLNEIVDSMARQMTRFRK